MKKQKNIALFGSVKVLVFAAFLCAVPFSHFAVCVAVCVKFCEKTCEKSNLYIKLLYKAYIDDEDTGHKPDLSFLTVEQYNILLNKGFENLSTFDQDYNK